MKHLLDDYGEAIIYTIIGLAIVGILTFFMMSISGWNGDVQWRIY